MVWKLMPVRQTTERPETQKKRLFRLLARPLPAKSYETGRKVSFPLCPLFVFPAGFPGFQPFRILFSPPRIPAQILLSVQNFCSIFPNLCRLKRTKMPHIHPQTPGSSWVEIPYKCLSWHADLADHIPYLSDIIYVIPSEDLQDRKRSIFRPIPSCFWKIQTIDSSQEPVKHVSLTEAQNLLIMEIPCSGETPSELNILPVPAEFHTDALFGTISAA